MERTLSLIEIPAAILSILRKNEVIVELFETVMRPLANLIERELPDFHSKQELVAGEYLGEARLLVRLEAALETYLDHVVQKQWKAIDSTRIVEIEDGVRIEEVNTKEEIVESLKLLNEDWLRARYPYLYQ